MAVGGAAAIRIFSVAMGVSTAAIDAAIEKRDVGSAWIDASG